ncbi:type VI secretion system Vgr family protein [Variovorax boronicumulans]|uniref:type VI secretion system Vgr family protein n=1 Tax=Variovorax boronicumulans TaxID=436515 RepID=UPI001C56F467
MSHTLSIHSPAIPMVGGVAALEPVRLSGREGVNSLFEYELLLKTPEALNLGASGAMDFDLDAFIGRELGCVIELDGSGEFVPGAVGASVDRVGAGKREINALITDACLWGEEGRHVQYKLTLRPWLHLATLSTDCKIYQNQSVVQILEALLGDYPFPVDKRLIERYPVRDYQTQYNESDFEFFSRLCQEWGINYFFEHSDDKHRLVLIDGMGGYQKNPSKAYQAVEYHAPGWKTDAEYLHSFVPANRLTSGQYSTRDYDYTRPRADLSVGRGEPRPTGQANGEVYQWHAGGGNGTGPAGSHYVQPRAGAKEGAKEGGDPLTEGRQLALLRMQALRTAGSRATASGNLRAMVPGCSFKLQKHPRDAANTEYLILETRLLIEDVAQDSQNRDAALGRKQQWKVEVELTAHPLTEPLRPVMCQPKPHTQGPQVAIVVGPAGENLWTDELGRIKVQFPWDRLGQKNEHASCWIRVSSPWAGNQLGGVHIPRVGQEVVVDFIGGDADLPICTGRVHNQMNLPPWELPGQGALSGFRSRELTKEGGNSAAGRSNHLVLDDTEGKIQAQLKSDHQSSSISLGFITRIEDNQGRKDPRGEGFELRTDGHGAIRASDGLLITTEGRPNAASHVKYMGETVTRLKAAQTQHESLAQAASTAKAQSNDQDQGTVAKTLKAQHDAIQGEGQADRDKASFPELSGPHLVLASAAGVAATTSQSVHLQAGEHIAVTSQAHTSLSVAKRLLISAKDGLRLFALKNSIKVIAGNGKVQIEAHKDKLDATARQAVRITSSTESILISAPKKVVFNGGGSFTEWSGAGIVHGTRGAWVEHAGSHVKKGPTKLALEPEAFKKCAPNDSSAATGGGAVI